MSNRWNIAALAVALALVWAPFSSAQAEGLLFSKKFYGYVSLGSSGWFIQEAYRARQDANDAYDLYKRAETSSSAQEFYDESRRFDTRMVVMGAMGVGALAWSMRLFRAKKEEELPLPRVNERSLRVKGVGIDLGGDLLRQKVQMTLSKDF